MNHGQGQPETRSTAGLASIREGEGPSMAEKERMMQEIKRMDFSREADILKVLAHPVRLQIAYGLSRVGDCNVKNIWSCLGLSQSSVSQHLNLMKNRGLIGSRRHGVEVHYHIEHPALAELIRCIMKHKGDTATDWPPPG